MQSMRELPGGIYSRLAPTQLNQEIWSLFLLRSKQGVYSLFQDTCGSNDNLSCIKLTLLTTWLTNMVDYILVFSYLELTLAKTGPTMCMRC